MYAYIGLFSIVRSIYSAKTIDVKEASLFRNLRTSFSCSFCRRFWKKVVVNDFLLQFLDSVIIGLSSNWPLMLSFYLSCLMEFTNGPHSTFTLPGLAFDVGNFSSMKCFVSLLRHLALLCVLPRSDILQVCQEGSCVEFLAQVASSLFTECLLTKIYSVDSLTMSSLF